MLHQHRVGLVLLTSLTLFVVSTTASAQFETGFEAPLHFPGPLEFQDDWEPFGANYPRVQTAAQIAQELEDAGLNPANPVRSGDQAMLYTYNPPDETGPGGGLMRRRFTGLEETMRVIVEWWARPLTPGSEGSTIGFNQGNTFVGIQDDIDSGIGNDQGRGAAVRFGFVDGVRTIDWASASAATPSDPNAVWIPSGIEWEADVWYNFQMHLDYESKRYDLYVNGTKANSDPIVFYRETSKWASTFFVSRGTNQAGQIIDDVSIYAAPPGIPGDFDGDGIVDGHDFLAWQRDTSVGNLSDWEANFGNGTLQAAAVAAVPEPSAGLLMVGMGLAFMSRRRRGRG